MKTLLLAALLVFTTPAHALNNSAKNDEKLAALVLLTMIDHHQSVHMFYKCGDHLELNPIIGARPDRRDLVMYQLAGLGIAYGLNDVMPEGKFKDFLIDSVLATEKFNIEENQKVISSNKRTFDCIMLVMSFNF